MYVIVRESLPHCAENMENFAHSYFPFKLHTKLISNIINKFVLNLEVLWMIPEDQRQKETTKETRGTFEGKRKKWREKEK